MNDPCIEFRNFQPSTFTKDYLNAKLAKIRRQVPPDANLHAVFVVNEGILNATLKIVSAEGELTSTTKGPFLKDVIRRLFIRMRGELRTQRKPLHRSA